MPCAQNKTEPPNSSDFFKEMSSQINASPDINDQLTKDEQVKNEPENFNIAAEDVVVALAAPRDAGQQYAGNTS